ncbi:MAG: lysophospholipid acyltransferase family protein [Thermotogota bacterium]|nr:lysophospholipid acyltransferase family protein [Thermotogota bacterium]
MRKRTKILWKIGLPGIRLWINMCYDLRVNGSFPEPPFLLLANHTQNIDPFFISATIKKPVSFVANKAAFQNPVVGLMLRWIDSIPKQKSTSDMKTVMGIFRCLKAGRVVGIFPEGHATWTGESMKAYGGTAKLLDKVNIPIVTCSINGGYLVNPRWARKRRKGPIELIIKTHTDSKALDDLVVSDWKWQAERGYLYRGSKKALGIERVMWFCPICGSYRTVKGKDNNVFCTACDYSTQVNENGRIGKLTVSKILKEQKEKLKKWLEEKHEKLVFDKASIKIWGKERKIREKKERGTVVIGNDCLIFNEDKFQFNKIRGLNTFVSTILEFLYEEKLIRIRTADDSLLLFNVLKAMGVNYNVLARD